MLDALIRDRAGRSATRRYKALARAWRRRIFGRRFSFYFWTIYSLLVLLIVSRYPHAKWWFTFGSLFGAAAVTWMLLPDVLMPASIFRWQLGAWGEQNTAGELGRLKREGWTVVHDARWGKGNHDHLLAGPAVFVLNSKNVSDSRVTVAEHGHLRVTHIDTDDGYLADKWVPTIEREARTLERALERELGFGVAVYPVIVIWGAFDAGQCYAGEVSVVHGSQLTDWLRSRPADLLTDAKRQLVARAVRDLPRA